MKMRMHCLWVILMTAIFLNRKYEEMDVVKKQQALMDGVVLEESTLPTASTYFDDENIEYRMEAGDGCSSVPERNRSVVTKEGRAAEAGFPWAYRQ